MWKRPAGDFLGEIPILLTQWNIKANSRKRADNCLHFFSSVGPDRLLRSGKRLAKSEDSRYFSSATLNMQREKI
jgi:hypothetical protein